MPEKSLVRIERVDLSGLTLEERAIVKKAARIDKNFTKSVGAIGTPTAGVYTNIELTAPEVAEEGTVVNVIARVQNLTGSSKYITVTGMVDSTEITFAPSYLLVGEHQIGEFSVAFYMPNRAVRVSAGSWYLYEEPDKWALDDQDYVDIALPGVPAAGTITKMELEYDESRGDIPVSNVPQGQRGLVHIWGLNDTDSAQQMGISWTVRDPDGITIEVYSDWEDWPYTGAGGDHEFIGGRFDLNKVGNYLLDVGLFMYPDAPVMVDEYRGVLCTVQEVAPELETLEVRINPVGAGYVTVSPAPSGGSQHNWQFPYGTTVYVTAHPNPGYIFESWSGEMTDTTAITAPVYPMTEHRLITAHFDVYVEYAGTITKMELEYDESRGDIPVYDIPQLQRGLVHIWGRNDTSVTQDLQISWVVRDPVGTIVETYSDWSSGHGPGDDHEFLGGRFDLAKVGTYTIAVDLLMNPDSPVVVDSYTGNLCTVTTELPPEYTLIQHTVSSYAYVYDGEVEVTTADFRVIAFVPSAWAAEQFAKNLEDEVKDAGARVIEVKAYVDITPLLWTDIRIEVTASPITGTSSKGTGIHPAFVALVPYIVKALLIIGILVAFIIAVKTVSKVFQRKPIDEEIKLAMAKGTLVSLAVDLEAKLELTPTPIDVLEGQTKGELIEYCDELAEEIVPPGVAIPWMWIAIGTIGVLGVAALTMGRKR